MNYNEPYKSLGDPSDNKVYFFDKPPEAHMGYAKAVNIYLVRQVDKTSTVFDYTASSTLGVQDKFVFVSDKTREIFKTNKSIPRTTDVKACSSYYCLMEVAPELVCEIKFAEPAKPSEKKNNLNSKSEEKQ